MRMDDLVTKITADLEAGYAPFCVVANAGTVDTGAVDPLLGNPRTREPVPALDARGWKNGAFAVLAESATKLFAGMEQADSIALDPHKWLYFPVDVGCVIYRDPEIARATFAHEAEYTRMFGGGGRRGVCMLGLRAGTVAAFPGAQSMDAVKRSGTR